MQGRDSKCHDCQILLYTNHFTAAYHPDLCLRADGQASNCLHNLTPILIPEVAYRGFCPAKTTISGLAAAMITALTLFNTPLNPVLGAFGAFDYSKGLPWRDVSNHRRPRSDNASPFLDHLRLKVTSTTNRTFDANRAKLGKLLLLPLATKHLSRRFDTRI